MGQAADAGSSIRFASPGLRIKQRLTAVGQPASRDYGASSERKLVTGEAAGVGH